MTIAIILNITIKGDDEDGSVGHFLALDFGHTVEPFLNGHLWNLDRVSAWDIELGARWERFDCTTTLTNIVKISSNFRVYAAAYCAYNKLNAYNACFFQKTIYFGGIQAKNYIQKDTDKLFQEFYLTFLPKSFFLSR